MHQSLKFLFSIAFISITVCVVSPVAGQPSAVALFNPPLTAVAINAFDLPANGRVPTLARSNPVGGASNGDCMDLFPHDCAQFPVTPDYRPPIHWESIFDNAFPLGLDTVTACGYGNLPPPTAVLTLPDGSQAPLTPVLYVSPHVYPEDGCYTVTFNSQLGMALGMYQLTLKHPQQELTHSWMVTYPASPILIPGNWHKGYGQDKTLIPDYLFMGLPSRTALKVFFFTRKSENTSELVYVTSRDLQTDAYGTLALNITIAPGIADNIHGIAIETDQPSLVSNNSTLVYPNSPYTVTKTPVVCSGKLQSRLKIGDRAGVIAPVNLNSNPARPSIDYSKSANVGHIAVGDFVTILNGPICNHHILWWQVNYNEVIGWTGEFDDTHYWLVPAQ